MHRLLPLFRRSFSDFRKASVEREPSQQVGARLSGGPFGFASMIDSVHFYIMVAVIEKRMHKLTALPNEKRGTEWQPFFDDPSRL